MSAALLALCRDLDDVQACPLLRERLRQVADRVVESLPGLTLDDLAQHSLAANATQQETNAMASLPSFTWSDDCPDRGWLSFEVHPDTRPARVQEYGRDMWADERRCCGWYLLYSRPEDPALPVSAAAYVRRIHPTLGTEYELRPDEKFRRFATIEEARLWLVEQATKLAIGWRWSPAGDLIPA